MNKQIAKARDFKAEMTEIMANWNPTADPQFLNGGLRKTILGMVARQSEITLATVRADGWPQANVVDIWNLGLMLYFQSYEASSKVQNIERDSRVSLTLTPSFKGFGEMQGITMAARAEKVTDKAEIGDLYHQFLTRLPHMKQFAEYEEDTAYPGPGMAVYRLKPEMGCVLDFTKGYGHWDYVQFRADDFEEWEVKYG
jgi:general stress protein 26